MQEDVEAVEAEVEDVVHREVEDHLLRWKCSRLNSLE